MSLVPSTPSDLIVNPVTGEAFALDAPTDTLAQYLVAMKEVRRRVREEETIVQGEILRRLDHDGCWTVHTPHGKVSAPSPAPVEEWDAGALHSALLELHDQGLLSIEAVNRAIEEEVTFKVRKAGVNALRKLGGRVRETVDAHARIAEPRRYVRVSE